MRSRHASGATAVNLGIIVTPMLDMSFQLLSFFIMVYSPSTGEEFIAGELTKARTATATDTAVKGIAPIDKKDIKPLPGADETPTIEQTLSIYLTNTDPRFIKEGIPVVRIESKDSVEPQFIQIKTPWNPFEKKEGGAFDINLINLGMPPFWEKDPDLKAKQMEHRKKELGASFLTLQKTLASYHAKLVGEKKKEEVAKKEKAEGGFKAKIKIEAERNIQFDYIIQVYAVCRRAGFEEISFVTPD